MPLGVFWVNARKISKLYPKTKNRLKHTRIKKHRFFAAYPKRMMFGHSFIGHFLFLFLPKKQYPEVYQGYEIPRIELLYVQV